MLRNVVGALAAVAVIASGAAVVLGGPAALPVFVTSLLVLVGTLWERVRYKRLAPVAPDPRFRRTPERFLDPETGAKVTVYADPATGDRAYVRE